MGFLDKARKMADQAHAKIAEARRSEAEHEPPRAGVRDRPPGPAAGASARAGRAGPQRPQRRSGPAAAARPR
jgi:hypothetical protein